MGIALQKVIGFLLLIGIGVLLKQKITSKEELKGVKAMILNIALPATIFIALLKIQIKPNLLLLPVLALAANFLLWWCAKFFLRIAGLSKDSTYYRTLLLLISSFAPGLSCFPFVAEFLGEQSLAMAAFADVGNKIFVLIISYLLAMSWYYQLVAKQRIEVHRDNSRLKDLGLALLREPINSVLLAAIGMLCLGLNLQSLPTVLQDTVGRMSVLMTPLVLIFIGVAVKVNKSNLLFLIQILCWRSGIGFLMSAILLIFLPPSLPVAILVLAVVFPQSACSFWPFAHMTAVETLEHDQPALQTFDLNLALNILAFSLPFSTIIILIVCSSGAFFIDTSVLFSCGLALLVVAVVPILLKVGVPFSLKKKLKTLYYKW